MLKTREERVRLLKAGLTGKKIEKLYIKYNNIKIVKIGNLDEIEISKPEYNTSNMNCQPMLVMV